MGLKATGHCFSAVWRRSSVVSVRIGLVLISDMSSMGGQFIKWISGAVRWKRNVLCPLGAMTWSCSTPGNGAHTESKQWVSLISLPKDLIIRWIQSHGVSEMF